MYRRNFRKNMYDLYRNRIIQYMRDLCDDFRLDVCDLAIKNLDSYMTTQDTKLFTNVEYQLSAMTIVMLSAKVSSSKFPYPSALCYSCDNRFSKEDFKNKELSILDSLEWRIHYK